MSFTTCLIVLLGGALGTLARHAVSVAAAPISGSLPWGTIIANVSGSFLIGLVATLTLAQGRFPAPEGLRLFVMVGFCGGYTTFSSFSLQTLDLLRSGALLRAGINVAGSLILCLLAVWLGHLAGAQMNGGGPRIAQIEEEG